MIEWGTVAWRLIACCLIVARLPSADRMWSDISFLASSGLWPEGWNISWLLFLPLTFPPSMSPFFFTTQLLPWNSSCAYSASSSSQPPLLPSHLSIHRLIVDWYQVRRGKPTKQRRRCCLQSPEWLISPRHLSLLSASYCTYVIPLTVLNSGVWAVCALRCETLCRDIQSTFSLERKYKVHYSSSLCLIQPTQVSCLPDEIRVNKWPWNLSILGRKNSIMFLNVLKTCNT